MLCTMYSMCRRMSDESVCGCFWHIMPSYCALWDQVELTAVQETGVMWNMNRRSSTEWVYVHVGDTMWNKCLFVCLFATILQMCATLWVLQSCLHKKRFTAFQAFSLKSICFSTNEFSVSHWHASEILGVLVFMNISYVTQVCQMENKVKSYCGFNTIILYPKLSNIWKKWERVKNCSMSILCPMHHINITARRLCTSHLIASYYKITRSVVTL